MAARFADRRDAGQFLARQLAHYAGRDDVVVLGLPRGGVPVAFEVATALGAPLDVFVVRKLGVPGREELAMGAIAGGVTLVNDRVMQMFGITPEQRDAVIQREREELSRRQAAYRGHRPGEHATGKVAILVDDGLATGSTMRVAVEALRRQRPATIVVAVPIAAREACEELADLVDDIVCAVTPDRLYAIGMWYEDFSQTSDEEVRALLAQAARQRAAARAPVVHGAWR